MYTHRLFFVDCVKIAMELVYLVFLIPAGFGVAAKPCFLAFGVGEDGIEEIFFCFFRKDVFSEHCGYVPAF